jgi:hypothetical protein
MLGVGGRYLRGAQALQRSDVARCHHHHAAREPRLPQRMLEELADLAASLADQRDDDDVGSGTARYGAEQRALAHARPREEANALSFAER